MELARCHHEVVQTLTKLVTANPRFFKRILPIGVLTFYAAKQLLAILLAHRKSNKLLKKLSDENNETKVHLLQKLVGLKTPVENKEVYGKLTLKQIRKLLNKVKQEDVQIEGDLKIVDLLEAFLVKALDYDRDVHFISEIVYESDVIALCLDTELSIDRSGLKDSGLFGIPIAIDDSIPMRNLENSQILRRKEFPKQVCDKYGDIIFVDSSLVSAIKSTNAIIAFKTTATPGNVAGVFHNSRPHPLNNSAALVNYKHPGRLTGAGCDGMAQAVASVSVYAGIVVDYNLYGAHAIQLPAVFSEICAIRCTPGRFMNSGLDNYHTTNPLLPPSIGIMANDVNSLTVTYRSMVELPKNASLNEYDFNLPPIKFDIDQYYLGKCGNNDIKFKIGVLNEIKSYGSYLPPIMQHQLKAMKKAECIIKHIGDIEVVEFEAPELTESLLTSLLVIVSTSINLKEFLNNQNFKIGKEMLAYIDSVRCFVRSRYLKKLILEPFNHLFGLPWGKSPKFEEANEKEQDYLIGHILNVQRFRHEFLTRMKELDVLGVVAPSFPYTAPTIDYWKQNGVNTLHVVYQVYFALLQCPIGITPVEVKDTNKVLIKEELIANKGQYNRYSNKFIDDQYRGGNDEKAVGSVQVLTMPFMEEMCLGLIRRIEDQPVDF